MRRTRQPVRLNAGDYLHVETPLGIVNIRTGLRDEEGHRVDSIEVIPDWNVSFDGHGNNRLIGTEED